MPTLHTCCCWSHNLRLTQASSIADQSDQTAESSCSVGRRSAEMRSHCWFADLTPWVSARHGDLTHGVLSLVRKQCARYRSVSNVFSDWALRLPLITQVGSAWSSLNDASTWGQYTCTRTREGNECGANPVSDTAQSAVLVSGHNARDVHSERQYCRAEHDTVQRNLRLAQRFTQ